MSSVDIVAAVLILAGATLALTAAIGIVRFPDTLARMHAATKPQVLGLLLVLAGAVTRLQGHADVGMLILFNLGLGFFVSNVSIGGHIGGLVGGALGGLAVAAGDRRGQAWIGWAGLAGVAIGAVVGAELVA